MSNNEIAKTNGVAPQLAESMRRLLADPFRSSDDWLKPDVPPETQKLRVAKAELERGLLPADGKHMHWCITKLIVLPARDGQAVTQALFAENFIDACGHYPEDLWTEGTKELLKTKTFRVSPAELVAVVDRKFCERKRMLDRVQQMLAGDVKKPDAPFVQEDLSTRLLTLRNSLKRIGQVGRAAVHERELAALEGRAIETWAIPAEERVEVGVLEPNTEVPADHPLAQARMLILAAAFHRKHEQLEVAKIYEARARKLAPQLFEEAANATT